MRSYNGGVAPDRSRSFYVGDAAGRSFDHSDVDKCALQWATHCCTPHTQMHLARKRGGSCESQSLSLND